MIKRHKVAVAFVVGWLLGLFISPATLTGMFKGKRSGS